MKRLHVHIAVSDLNQSVGFYSTLFGAEPTVLKDDYAKWMLDDPRVNFAISTHGSSPGLDHLGIQVEEAGELTEIAGRLKAGGAVTFDESATVCCYAQSDKSWVQDPSGLRWETFHTLGEAAVYGEDHSAELIPQSDSGACCAPRAAPAKAAACCGGTAAMA
jgi:catechol 2,3-dioxygenase-like lactoylglutathione lyase family enzyme